MNEPEGSDAAFRELVEARWHRWSAVAFLVLQDERQAHDAVLETFVRTHQDWAELPGSPSVSALTALVRRVRDRAESTSNQPPDPSDDLVPIGESEHTARLVTAYAGLPVGPRLALALRAIEDLTDDEIAVVSRSTPAQVAQEVDHGLAELHSVVPPSWSHAQLESALRGALRGRTDRVLADEDPWQTTQLALVTARRRRRRTAGAFVGALVLALVAAGGATVALTDDSPAPQAVHDSPTATSSRTMSTPLDARSTDLTRWPLRGSLRGRLDLLEPLRSSPRLDELSGTQIYIDRFIYAGDVGRSRYVLGYTKDITTNGGPAGVVIWTGPRGAPPRSLQPTLSFGAGASLLTSVHQLPDASGEMLILGPDVPTAVRVSPGPLYHLDGSATRTWTTVALDHGVGTATLPAQGPNSTLVRGESGENAIVEWPFQQSESQPPSPAPSSRYSGDYADLIDQFLSSHRLARTAVSVLDTRTFRFRAPAPAPFDNLGRQSEVTPLPRPDVDWIGSVVVLQRPDGTVFRSGRVRAVTPDPSGNDGAAVVYNAPTDARRWQRRPLLALSTDQEQHQEAVLLAPDAQRVEISGKDSGQVRLTRVAPGVFRGELAARGWFTDPLRLTVRTYDADGRPLGTWPLLTIAETDPDVTGDGLTGGMVTRTY
ncbi:hypothetical protein PZ938_12105 [Luteipulveratus sp. YIM 133132]|uniref:RNA polymerase sigma factor n=1 Tax=Luteipulveratus flavus TaxID=3031728 RepID=UPI0023B11720|nr:hypothetical protein [Luteipulveratus sp. YIM 133132]MDE9366345.1 hypothetical protein [Luteipulveratus sp. YIM 133132]